jgi:lipid-binding SYLF domain-containing protein
MNISTLSAVFFAATFLFGGLTLAQQSKADQIGKAVERDGHAADVLSKIVATSSSPNGIPKELLESAKAVAVFPNVTDANLLIQQITSGFGVISTRLSGNWSYPAYYSFKGIGYDLNAGGVKSSDIILLLMSEQSLNLLQKKSVELKGEAQVMVGPIGTITSEQKAALAGANVIGYVASGGKIVGKNIKSNFLKGFKISADDNINKAIYGIKGQEVLAGSQKNVDALPKGITSFQETLSRYSVR